MSPPQKEKKPNNGFKPGNQLAKRGKRRVGRPSLDREEKLMIAIDKDLVKRYLTMNFHKTLNQLKVILKTGRISSLENMLIQSIIRACETGDIYLINGILDRLIGKVDLNVKITKPNKFEGMTDEQLLETKVQLEEINRKTLNYIETTYSKFQEYENEAQQLVEHQPSVEATTVNPETTKSVDGQD